MFRDRVWAVLLVILDEVEVCPHLQRCVCFVIRNTYATCTHHGVLRMIKPMQRCEGCKILRSTLNRRQNVATAVFPMYSGAAPFSFAQMGACFQSICVNPISFAFGANDFLLIVA